MCGIVGFVGWDLAEDEGDRHLSNMCDAIRHRGPDDEGHFVDRQVGLGMRRLSIIDLEGGHQPISNEDGRVTVVFNGEIYNYRELRSELSGLGHRFKTDSDTETLVHLYEERGEDLVHALNGMFGFAIWDGGGEGLFVARDRLGIKPIYYWEHAGGVAFASELSSLARLPDFPSALDATGIAYYMALGYIPEPLTAFPGVRKLPAGHLLRWDERSGVSVRQYWDPAGFSESRVDEGESVEEIRRLLSDSVRLRLIADVPLGGFLSGGTDSSAVVAMMVRHSTNQVRTFSIGFEESEYNEAAFAAELAEGLGTDHTELVMHPDADQLVESIVSAFGEPFADSSAIPTFLVSRLAREHVKVALSGDGGDELFGGYTRYAEMAKRLEVPFFVVRGLLGSIGRSLPQAWFGRNRILDWSRSRRGRYAGTVSLALSTSEGGVMRRDFARLLPPVDSILDPWFDRVTHRDFLSQISLVDILTYLPGDILTKVDRMSMVCSLEARVPILDHRLVELAVRLPSALKFRGNVGKQVFRKAIEPLVPPAVLRRPKSGFAVPLDRWFREELPHRVEEISDPVSPIFEFLEFDAVKRTVAEHLRGRRDHSHLIWRILVLHLWLKRSRPSE